MKAKRLISIILALIISCQSLSLNVFANNAEIEDILSYVNSTAQTPDDYTGNASDYEEISEELPPSYDELPENGGIQIAPDIIDDSSLVLDPALSDTVSERTSALLDIDYASAQRMIAAYGSEETALSEAENYARLKESFYALDNANVKDKLLDLVISGYGSQRVAYSGIVAIVLDADIEDVILKDSDIIPDDDIYTQYLAQQLFVSPLLVADYTFETGLSTEVMYNLVVSALQDAYPSVFNATALSSNPNGESTVYPYSPYYVDISENERISPVSGALTYIMDLASIPGVNGMDIDIALRYDSDRSVAQGEYKVTYGGHENPDGSFAAYSIHEYDPFSWDDRSIFMFGTGWRLNYDYIYRRDGSLLLILSDGRQYEITGSSPNYRLNGFNSSSLTLTGINENDAKYKLTYYDGTVEKFNSKGDLLSKTDRYGNCITFIHESITNPQPYTDKLVISNSHSTVTIIFQPYRSENSPAGRKHYPSQLYPSQQ